MAKRRAQPAQAKRRQLEGSRRGAEAVRVEFAAAITRRRYCELVDIHPTTLRKWERQGLVKPQMAMILRSPTRIFSEQDVAFGQRLIALLRSRRGEISIAQAAVLARRQLD